jgi:hypothetical protein
MGWTGLDLQHGLFCIGCALWLCRALMCWGRWARRKAGRGLGA